MCVFQEIESISAEEALRRRADLERTMCILSRALKEGFEEGEPM